MPITEKKHYHMPRLHRWFAITSVILFFTIFWMIWEDYDRPWKKFQDDYTVAQAGLAHLDYLIARHETGQEEIAAATRLLEEARTAVAARADERAALEAKLADAQIEFVRVKLPYSNADSVLQVTRDTYERIKSEFGPNHPRTRAARRQLDAEIAKVDHLRAEKERTEDRVTDLTHRLRGIDAPVREAQEKLETLRQAAEEAAKKEKEYGRVLVKSIINAPFMDFAAPKGTPTRHEVRQLVLPDVRQRLNFLESYTTDRCITCHSAIDNKSFSKRNVARKLERAIPAINEELVRQSKAPVTAPPPPRPGNAPGGAPQPGTISDVWEQLTAGQQDVYFHRLLAVVNDYLDRTGRKRIKLDDPNIAHPDLNLFVAVDSPHAMVTMGCTVCHEGNPQETDFVLAAHSAEQHHKREEWAKEYYVRRAGVPLATFEVVEHYWDRPMLPKKYTEASCMKCHHQVSDISTYDGEHYARLLNLGRNLFTTAGCINCHLVKGLGDSRRVGPNLNHVAAKLSRGFIDRWVFNPRDFRPSTWMPHFFNQENNAADSANEYDPDPVRRTETEVQAMRHYLYTFSMDWEPGPIPEGLTGDAERGRELFRSVGCLACHAQLAEFGEEWITKDMVHRLGKTPAQAAADFAAMTYNDRVQYAWDHFGSDRQSIFDPESVRFGPEAEYNVPIFTRFAPELSAVGSKVSVEWLYSWLRRPDHYAPDTKMPDLRVTEQEALDLAVYLAELKHDTFDDSEFARDEAHTRMADDLVFLQLTGQRSANRARAIMDDENGELTELLVAGLATSSLGDDARRRVEDQDPASKRLLFLGSKMISHYGCYACHLIPGFEEASRPGTDLTTWAEKPISQLDFAFFFSAFDDMRAKKHDVFGKLYPPNRTDLIHLNHGENPDEQIHHSHAAFAYHKLRNPRIWDREKIKRPYDKLKMPNFYFSDLEAEALVTYLLGRRPPRVRQNLMVDYEEPARGKIAAGRNLTRELNCLGCHRIEDNVATVHQYYRTKIAGTEYFDEVNAPPMLHGEGAKVQHAWLYGFLRNVELLRPWLEIRMPSFRLTRQETTTLVEYFAGLAAKEAEEVGNHLARVHEFRRNAPEPPPTAEGESAGEPGGDWFKAPRMRSTRDALSRYALTNRLVGPFDLDPAESTEADLVHGYGKVVERTGFLQRLYDVPFPFVDSPRPLINEERFHTGTEMFYEFQCLNCHVLGDPAAPGSNRAPTAPNLNLTHRRLRQDWVRAWVQEPAWIQPGTKMPQLFPGEQSFFRDYPDEDRQAAEARFGATGGEQIALLIDFLYDAGMRNFTGVQPGGVAAPPAAGEEEEFLEDDEEEEFFDEDEEEDD